MSKAVEKKEEEEWEDVEEGEEEEEEEDTSIKNSDVVVRYKQAAKWANEVLAEVLAKCVPDASILAICQAGDKSINEKVATNFKQAEMKGIAFPTCISVGSAVCHQSPTPGEDGADATLKLNDVIRVELGVHVDGFAAFVAHTAQVVAEGGATGALNAESPEAAAIGATYQALDAALRTLRPGASTYDVTKVLELAAEHSGLKPLDGVLSHELKRFIPDGFKTIPGRQEPEHKVHEYEIEPHTVWHLDVVFTTGKTGKAKATEQLKTTLYKPALDPEYQPKLDAALQVAKEIEEKVAMYPFAIRNLETKKTRLGLSELLKHNVVHPMPVLFVKDGETVIRFAVTLLVSDKKIERVTGLAPQAGYKKPEPYTDEFLLACSKKSLSLVDKKKK